MLDRTTIPWDTLLKLYESLLDNPLLSVPNRRYGHVLSSQEIFALFYTGEQPSYCSVSNRSTSIADLLMSVCARALLKGPRGETPP